jgi:hypothetical protein
LLILTIPAPAPLLPLIGSRGNSPEARK